MEKLNWFFDNFCEVPIETPRRMAAPSDEVSISIRRRLAIGRDVAKTVKEPILFYLVYTLEGLSNDV